MKVYIVDGVTVELLVVVKDHLQVDLSVGGWAAWKADEKAVL